MKLSAVLIFGICLCGCSDRAASGGQAAVVSSSKAPVMLQSGALVNPIVVSDDFERRSWHADGSPMDAWVAADVLRNAKDDRALNSEGLKSVVVTITTPTYEVPSVLFRDGGADVVDSNTLLDSNPTKHDESTRWIAWYSRRFGSRASTNVGVGIATGPWQQVCSYRQAAGKFEHAAGSELQFTVLDHEASKGEEPPGTVIVITSFPETVTPRAFELVLRDRSGKQLTSAGWARSKSGNVTEYWFRGRRADVGTIELRSREYEWQDYRDVKLNAGL